MAIGGESAGVLFTIKADANDAIRDLNRVQKETKELGTAGTGLASSFTSLVNPTALVAAGLAAVATAAIAGTRAIYDLAVSTADFGSKIFDAQAKTGLAADTLSALKVQAEQSGSSFEAITGSVAKFNVIVGEANQGNEKATATLAKYGITAGETANALEQAVKAISEMESADQRAVAAKELFKDRTGEVLAVLDSLGGSVSKTTQRLKELGVTIDDDAARAADEFGDQMDLLHQQIAAVGRVIGSEFIPIFLNMSRSVSNWLSANQGQIKAWATNTADALRGTISLWNQLTNAVVSYYKQSTPGPARGILAEIGKYNLGSYLRNRGEAERIAQGLPGNAGGTINAAIGTSIRSGGGGGASRAQSEAEAKAKAELDAQITQQQNRLKDAEDVYKRALEKLREEFKQTGDSAGFIQKATDALAELKRQAEELLPTLVALERQQAEGGTTTQVALVGEDQERRVRDLQQALNDSVDKNNDLVKDANEKQADITLDLYEKTESEIARIQRARLESFREESKRVYDDEIENLSGLQKAGYDVSDQLIQAVVDVTNFLNGQYEEDYNLKLTVLDREREARIDEIKKNVKDETERQKLIKAVEDEYYQKRLAAYEEFRKKLGEVADAYPIPVIASTEDNGYAPFSDLISGFNNFADQVEARGPTISESFQAIAGLGVAAFESMAQAIGNVVQQWVLYGSTGPAVMKKILAAALASLAAEAAVRAIFELALGFASLFFNPSEAAAHFTAAALFGSIAVGAALAGRAIAGDSFKKQAATATGGSAASTTRSNDTKNQGAGYSDKKDVVIEAGRNTPFTQRWEGVLKVEVRSNDSHIIDVVQKDVRGNGPLRQTIIQTAEQ